ncbi:TetR/AcrR family transcriptional regulator [Olsenella massiliensis]|uniref:TetR/AcrR family transcriptional regulator n=1 Tax=Olsenella massiliensis TaxID=1622075 RepID=UPI00071DC690|nr:TetR-like C-terminal domain-containing protein [Olsenella massiliensis]
MRSAFPDRATAPAPVVRRDRRALRTRAALRDALAAEIAATGDLSQVTVTAVTDCAGVTRRTFYSHFRDITDLVNQIEAETIADMRGLVANVAATHLSDLQDALDDFAPCPGAEELLRYFKDRGRYLAALLGDGGDPAFANRLQRVAREAVAARAADGLDVDLLGPVFDYYLTFAISAEVGVLVRWLTGGMNESVAMMARVMTTLMFVRPGDLYGRTMDVKIPSIPRHLQTHPKETSND